MTRMLVTRPEPDAQETAARLRALGILPVVVPLLELRTLDVSLPDPQGFSAMALTSANALRALAARGDIGRFRGLKVFAVGERTAEAARQAGFADVVAAGGNFGALVGLIAGSKLSGPLFYPAARDQAGDLAKALAPSGLMVVTARVYEMAAASALPADIAAGLGDGSIAAALFYSRRTAATFLACLDAQPLPGDAHRRLGMLCLSEAVAEPLIAARFVRIGLADHPSEEAMMALCLSFSRERNAP